MGVQDSELTHSGQEIWGIARVSGPIVVVEGMRGVAYDEVVQIIDPDGTPRQGRVVEISNDLAVVEVFAGTTGLSIDETRVQFLGHPMRMPVATEMLGRTFNGLGLPIDGGPMPLADKYVDINGQPINPTARRYPRDAIQTGISALDGMNTLVLGQKLPIFSGSGLPHNHLAAQIVRQSMIAGKDQSAEFAVVFAAMGIKHDVAEFFRSSFTESGALTRAAIFLNLADDPPIERLITPRAALTLAEYLAFEQNMHVLVILTDMTSYCEALRQISNIRGEVPSRKGYPGYLYSDLASIYERTGRVEGSEGSITQLPILSMPNDDITHPVPDLTGYITEGQVVLSRELSQRGIYPPVAVLPSLSRLMKDGIGAERTRQDHPNVAAQLYSAYARVQDVRSLASVIGEEELTPVDKAYLAFGRTFEQEFVGQGADENRSIPATLNIAWRLLALLPREELTRVTEEEIDEHRGMRATPGAGPAI